jgi:hypothetical protein
MAEQPIAYTAEVATRMRDLVFSLERDFRELEEASRATLGLAIAVRDDTSEIPDDLIADGLHFLAGQLVDRAHELNDRYFELFALAVNGTLPEDDDHCRERKGRKESPNLSLSLGPAG